jgi:hypothetical protein
MKNADPIKWIIACLLTSSGVMPLRAFTLLGPYAPWMTHAIGYRQATDLGGPMDIQEGYRWNIPLITYGFDQEFVDSFGQGGVEEVEKAVATLNDLPRASDMILTNFPLDTWRNNSVAAALGVVDLKSQTLGALLEQFGLTDSLRFAWAIRDRCVEAQTTNFIVLQRNFDPETLLASSFVNGEQFDYLLQPAIHDVGGVYADAVEVPVLLKDPQLDPVASVLEQPGSFCEGLSRDDAGGLRFLLGNENRKVESLLPGITAAPGSTNPIVNIALRPGVEKIQLMRMPLSNGRFVPVTNSFADTYITDGIVRTQQLQRVVTTPDILFRARDFGLKFYHFLTNDPPFVYADLWTRSDALAWQNNASLNGDAVGAGPGTITPGAEITFNNTGRYNGLGPIGGPYSPLSSSWGSFGESPESLIPSFSNERVTSATASTRLSLEEGQPILTWELLIQVEVNYRIDASANLKDWTPVGNLKSPFFLGFATFRHPISEEARYFRAVWDPE